jgi:DNA-binding transcriptional MerR regulator
MAQLQPYVLRSWEAEFPGLGQRAASGPGRVYARVDVDLVLRIKQMVFGEGLTLAGARRRLEEDQQLAPLAATPPSDSLGEAARAHLRQLRSGLEAILILLGADADRQQRSELQLLSSGPRRNVAASAGAQQVLPGTAEVSKAEVSKSVKGGAGKRRRAS